ncbi:MAG: UDP-N-acetylmuramate dehydrogenase [Planctomycetota bacterium]|nr:UDP-N-acetylmuramate dehydrogenase [Planctomycetota bacterium]MCX8039031.1 UDP-N-acetylmuramate dehydrogenase [Planctomycetota bacterium]MDW8372718.1 UDP-N-acetylmuramate dehydrogenase [Planctomycetota bacterium]
MKQGFSAGFCARNAIEERRLAELTTFRIGGPATLITVHHRDDLREALACQPLWLGKGANLLVGDAGPPRPVARLGRAFAEISERGLHDGRLLLHVGAAVDLAALLNRCLAAGWGGLEGLAGVPASIGGALRMNAGTAQRWFFDVVARVECVLPGEEQPRWLERREIPAAYRSCGLPAGTLFLGCELALTPDDPQRLRATAARLKAAKAASQPLALPSAGCVFKNPSRELPAGRLIDELGFKGARCGGAEVSTRHANFIVNPERRARAEDVVRLIRRIRRRAWQERGIALALEIETWGCPDELRADPAQLPEEET